MECYYTQREVGDRRDVHKQTLAFSKFLFFFYSHLTNKDHLMHSWQGFHVADIIHDNLSSLKKENKFRCTGNKTGGEVLAPSASSCCISSFFLGSGGGLSPRQKYL